MSEPILDPAYWAKRLSEANELLHHSIFKCPLDRWQRIEAQHRKILAATIENGESVLDCGCGYGRLLTLMPDSWRGGYYGVDISPDFIELARTEHPTRVFDVLNLLDAHCFRAYDEDEYDWAVLISVRPMVIRNLGVDVWADMEASIRTNAKRLLYLEYDEFEEGLVE